MKHASTALRSTTAALHPIAAARRPPPYAVQLTLGLASPEPAPLRPFTKS